MSFQNAHQAIMRFVTASPPQLPNNTISFVNAVSAANQSLSILNPMGVPGKPRTVILNVWPIQCDVEGDCSSSVCNDDVQPAVVQREFTLSRCTATRVYGFNKGDLRNVDGTFSWDQVGRAIINSILPSYRKLLAQEMATYLYDLAGVHLDGSSTKRLAPINMNNGAINPIAMLSIMKEFSDASYSQPYIYGGGELFYLSNLQPITGENANGVSIRNLPNANVFYDEGLSLQILNDAANGDHVLAVTPDTFRMVWFNENTGMFADSPNGDVGSIFSRLIQSGTETALNLVYPDPVTGYTYDFDIYNSACGKKINIQFKFIWDFFTMTNDCNPQGVNGIMHYRTCPPVAVECPAGYPAPTPDGPTQFSWAPGDVFPLYVGTLALGDNINTPNETATNINELAALFNETYGNGSLFSVYGSDIVYTGYSAISGKINDQTTITFA